jgi:hypothetical protein
MRKITLFLFLIIFSSCATYSKKDFKKSLINIDESNIASLNGSYKIFPVYSFNKKESNIPDSLKFRTGWFMYEMIQNSAPYYDKIASIAYNSAQVRIQNNFFKYILKNNDSIVKNDSIEFKLKKGMLRLKNSFYKCEGVPFIFGGCRNGRIRIGLSKSKNMIINKSYDQYGALLIIFGAGLTENKNFEYEKI